MLHNEQNNIVLKLTNGDKVMYNPKDVIGEGGGGIVYKGQITQPEKHEKIILSFGHYDLKKKEKTKVTKPCAIKKMLNVPANQDEKRYFEILDRKNFLGEKTIKNDKNQINHIYIAMNFFEGETLESLLKSGKVLSLEQKWQLAHDLLTQIAAVHEKGYAHRDLKPGNCMVDANGRLTIIDWGSACEEGTITDIRLGVTKLYLPPDKLFIEYCDLQKAFKKYCRVNRIELPEDYEKDLRTNKNPPPHHVEIYRTWLESIRIFSYGKKDDLYVTYLLIGMIFGFVKDSNLANRYIQFQDNEDSPDNYVYDQGNFERTKMPALKDKRTLEDEYVEYAEYNTDIYPSKEVYDQLIDILYAGTDWNHENRPSAEQILPFIKSQVKKVSHELSFPLSPITATVHFDENHEKNEHHEHHKKINNKVAGSKKRPKSFDLTHALIRGVDPLNHSDLKPHKKRIPLLPLDQLPSFNVDDSANQKPSTKRNADNTTKNRVVALARRHSTTHTRRNATHHGLNQSNQSEIVNVPKITKIPEAARISKASRVSKNSRMSDDGSRVSQGSTISKISESSHASNSVEKSSYAEMKLQNLSFSFFQTTKSVSGQSGSIMSSMSLIEEHAEKRDSLTISRNKNG